MINLGKPNSVGHMAEARSGETSGSREVEVYVTEEEDTDNAIERLSNEVSRLRTLVDQKEIEFRDKNAELEDKVTEILSDLASAYNAGICEMKKEFEAWIKSVENEVQKVRELLARKECENTDTEVKRLSAEVSLLRTSVEQNANMKDSFTVIQNLMESAALKEIQVNELASELAKSRASFTCLPQVGSKRPLEYGDPKKLFVGGIPSAVTEEKLKEAFSKYGTVKEHEIIRNLVTGLPRAFGFVVFDDAQVAEDLLAKGNFVDIGGAMVEIKKSIPKQKPTIALPPPVFDRQVSTKGGRWYFD